MPPLGSPVIGWVWGHRGSNNLAYRSIVFGKCWQMDLLKSRKSKLAFFGHLPALAGFSKCVNEFMPSIGRFVDGRLFDRTFGRHFVHQVDQIISAVN